MIIKLIRLTKALRLFLPWWFLNSVFNRTAREASRLLSFSGWRSISTIFISPLFTFSSQSPTLLHLSAILSSRHLSPLLRFAFFQAASSLPVSHLRQVGRGSEISMIETNAHEIFIRDTKETLWLSAERMNVPLPSILKFLQPSIAHSPPWPNHFNLHSARSTDPFCS